MEALHRLRIVWLILCALAAGTVALAWFGGTPNRIILPLLVGVALLAGAVGTRTWFGALSCLCMGGAAIAFAMALDRGDNNASGSVIVFGVGGYIALAAVMWIIKPMFKGGARP